MVQGARRAVGAFGRGVTLDPQPQELKAGDLQNLYNLLIAPILPDLPREPERVVTLAPQDWLYMVPFAALQDSQGHYLVEQDRKSTRLNSSHLGISYAVFCLKKKKQTQK